MPHSSLLVRTARLTVLAVLVVLAGCSGAQTRKLEFMQRGRDLLARGQYQQARVEFRNALQIAPKDASVRYFNGLALEKLGSAVPAAQFYQGAIDVRPDYVEARAHLGLLFLLYGDPNKALDTIAPALAKHPNDSSLLTVRAAARSRLGEPGAMDDAQKACKLAPRSENAVAVLTGIYLKAGRKADARAVLERGIADIPHTVALRLVLAEQFQQAHDSAQAEALLEQLVTLQPKEPLHRIDLAHFYAASNRLDEAEAVLRQGMQALPRSSQMRAALVEFLRARRGPQAAEAELHALIVSHPGDAGLQLQLAALYASENQVPQAEAQYGKVISVAGSDPAVIEAKDDLADLRLRQHDTAGAEALIAQVLSKDPGNDESLRMRAGLELAHGDATSAIADLRTVLRDEPDSIPDLRMLATAQAANGETDLAEQTLRQAMDDAPSDPSPGLDLIALLNRRHQPDQALQVADRLAGRYPKNPLVLTAAFQSQLAARSFTEAKATAATLRNANPKNPLGYYFSGLAADASGDAATAVRDYHEALAIAPQTREPLEALVRLYARQGKTGLALQEIAGIAKSQPKDAVPPALAGELQLALKRLPEASKSFSAAVALDPSWMAPYRGLAHAQLAENDVNGAISTLQSARGKVTPAEAPDLDLAALYSRLGRIDDAAAAYRQALKDNPASDEAANDLAMLLVTDRADQGDLDQALKVAQRFGNSSNPYYVDTLGWVQYKRGDLTRALSTLGQAVSLAPSVPVLHYHLAMAELKSGQTVAARDNLERALGGGKAFDGMAEARSLLTQLQSSGSRTAASTPTRD